MPLNIPSTETGYEAELAIGIGSDDTEIFISGSLPKVTANGILRIDRGTTSAEIISYASVNVANNSLTGCERGLPPTGSTLVGEAEYKMPHSSKANIACVSTHYIYEILKSGIDQAILTLEQSAKQYNSMNARLQKRKLDEITNLMTQLRNKQKRAEGLLRIEGQSFERKLLELQEAYETFMNSQFANFTASQRDITAIINTGDGKLLDISAGFWLSGITPRTYAGQAGVNPPDNAVTFYQLEPSAGALDSNAVGFTSGNFPICRVTTDSNGDITEIINYGGAYQVADAGGFSYADCTNLVYNEDGNIISFDDIDGVTWTQTFDANGEIATITDGIDTTTINRDAGGNFNGVTYS